MQIPNHYRHGYPVGRDPGCGGWFVALPPDRPFYQKATLGCRLLNRRRGDAWPRGSGRGRTVPAGVVQFLARSQDPAAGPALLAAYRASGHRNGDMAAAPGQLGHADAVPDLALGAGAVLCGGRGGAG